MNTIKNKRLFFILRILDKVHYAKNLNVIFHWLAEIKAPPKTKYSKLLISFVVCDADRIQIVRVQLISAFNKIRGIASISFSGVD